MIYDSNSVSNLDDDGLSKTCQYCHYTENLVYEMLQDLPKNQGGLDAQCLLVEMLVNQCFDNNQSTCTFESKYNIRNPSIWFRDHMCTNTTLKTGKHILQQQKTKIQITGQQ